MSKDGGPAFPTQKGIIQSGMSLRDWFASQALIGFAIGALSDSYGKRHWPDHAREAYGIADAMLAEREK